MLLALFITFIVALVTANPTSQQRRSRISLFLIFAATVVGAGTGATQEQGLVPRGTERPSFDCAKAKSAAARLICADGELTHLDGELGIAFQTGKAQLPESDQRRLVASQLAWINGRSARCGLDGKSSAAIEVLAPSKPCMANAIRERIIELSSSSGPKRPNSEDAKVPVAPRSAPSPADAAALREQAMAKFRKSHDSCTTALEKEGLAAVGAERQSQIDTCFADAEARLQADLNVPQQAALSSAPEQSQQAVRWLEVWIEASVTNELRPTVRGSTNLPDGTKLYIQIIKTWLPDAAARRAAGLSMCDESCGFLIGPEQEAPDGTVMPNATVRNGTFKAGPFADYKSRDELRDPAPGRYILEVATARPKAQPPEVLAVIGDRGQNMTGPLLDVPCADAGGIREKDHLNKDDLSCQRMKRVFNATEGMQADYFTYVKIGYSRGGDQWTHQSTDRSNSAFIDAPAAERTVASPSQSLGPTSRAAPAASLYSQREPEAREISGSGLGWALVILAVAALIIGSTAQSWKRRTGAAWGCGTFFLAIVAYLILYFILAPTSRDLFQRDAGWLALGIMTAVIVMVLQVAIIATLPRRPVD